MPKTKRYRAPFVAVRKETTMNISGKRMFELLEKLDFVRLSTFEGEKKAADIIAYREQNGPFNSIEDIMNITGIKEGLFNKISEYITV